MTEQEVADRARPYVTAAGAETRENDLLTAARRALCEAAALCSAEEAPDSLLEETGALAAGLYLLFPGAEGADTAQAVSVKEGDTQVQFSEEHSPGALRRSLARDLIDGARRDCARWRRLIW